MRSKILPTNQVSLSENYELAYLLWLRTNLKQEQPKNLVDKKIITWIVIQVQTVN